MGYMVSYQNDIFNSCPLNGQRLLYLYPLFDISVQFVFSEYTIDIFYFLWLSENLLEAFRLKH